MKKVKAYLPLILFFTALALVAVGIVLRVFLQQYAAAQILGTTGGITLVLGLALMPKLPKKK
ncbi:MAG: hypothetical protein J6J18_12480 [Oscillospiraceae bacterium]|nr:hypothetical protein [Oscillospiraceae bacterium]